MQAAPTSDLGGRWERAGAARLLAVRRAGARLPAAVLVGLAYAAGAGCSWLLFHAAATAVFFPPAGVTVGALICTPRRRWPGILAAAGAVEIGVDLWQGNPLQVSLGLAVANVLEPLVGASLLRLGRAGALNLSRRGDTAWFLATCVGLGPAIGAVVGSTTVAWGLHRGWWQTLGPYWAGDGLAVVTLGATIVGYHGRRAASGRAGRRAARAGLVLLAVALLTVLGFWPRDVPLSYLPLPVLVAVAFAGRVTTVTAAGFVMAFVANLVSGSGRGPWAALVRTPQLEAATLQLYLAFTVLTAWALAIEVSERDRARRRSERESAARVGLQALQDVTAELATAATSEQIATVLVQRGVNLVARYGAVAMLDAQADAWHVLPSAAYPDALARALVRIPLVDSGRTPATQAALTGRPVTLAGPDEIAARFPEVADVHAGTGTRSVLAVPVLVGTRSRGALAFAFAAEGSPDPDVVALAETLARLAGQALERAELFESERRAAHELQRALLPRIATDLPGVSAGVCYRAAASGRDVGGDWYDVFARPGATVGFAVGDVVGHDLHAATAMGRLQAQLRAVAVTGATPCRVLEALDQVSPDIEGSECATVGYAEYSPREHLLRYACAGHPPPLLITGTSVTGPSQVRYLWDGRSQPVGVPVGPRSQAQEAVPADALLVWYSDGLVERRGEDLDVGLQRLADTARRLVEQAGGLDHVDVQRWTETLLAELVADRLVDDDIVVACLRLHACLEQEEPGPVLRHTLGGTHELAELRAVLRTWADRQQLEASQTEALLLVCTEAATNAATHAQSAGATSAVEVTVRRAEHGQVQLEVSDRGSWQGADTDAEHGRGLALVARLAVRTTLDLREDGTRLTIILP